MNSTQKTAWIFLFSFFFGAVGFVYVGSIIAFGRMPPRPFGHIVVGSVTLAGLALLALTIFFIAKRQSPAEPESDERDKMIRDRAAAISLLGSWLLLAIVMLVLGLTLGQTGSIPVYLLTVLLFGVWIVTTLIYAIAVLAQYGRAGREASHE